MILVDTDHLSVLEAPSGSRRERLRLRLAEVIDETLGVPIVGIEEQMRGWLSAIAKERTARRQVSAYRGLNNLFRFFNSFSIIPFDDPAVDRFDELRAAKVRIGTMDLKIAAIALVNGALLLTANRQVFEQVPGLRFENWLD